MYDVLFVDGQLRDDRREWFTIAIDYVDITLIMPLELAEPPLWGITYVKRFRFTEEAIKALKRCPTPLFLITERTERLQDDVFIFEDNILDRYNLVARK